MGKLERELNKFGITIKQIDAACRVRFMQDYKSEMGVQPTNGWCFDNIAEVEKNNFRAEMLEILKAMGEKNERTK